jgi:hypothetical protein
MVLTKITWYKQLMPEHLVEFSAEMRAAEA